MGLKKFYCSAFLAILLLSGCDNDKTTGEGSSQSSEVGEVNNQSSEVDNNQNTEVGEVNNQSSEVDNNQNTEVVNQTPIVNAGEDKTVTVNETITITGTATDNDGTIVSYEWTKGSDVLGTDASLSYTPTVVGTDTLTLTVTDDDGTTASDTVNIVVVEDSNDNPFDDVKK